MRAVEQVYLLLLLGLLTYEDSFATELPSIQCSFRVRYEIKNVQKETTFVGVGNTKEDAKIEAISQCVDQLKELYLNRTAEAFKKCKKAVETADFSEQSACTIF